MDVGIATGLPYGPETPEDENDIISVLGPVPEPYTPLILNVMP